VTGRISRTRAIFTSPVSKPTLERLAEEFCKHCRAKAGARSKMSALLWWRVQWPHFFTLFHPNSPYCAIDCYAFPDERLTSNRNQKRKGETG